MKCTTSQMRRQELFLPNVSIPLALPCLQEKLWGHIILAKSQAKYGHFSLSANANKLSGLQWKHSMQQNICLYELCSK